jgi:predicted lipoprotein
MYSKDPSRILPLGLAALGLSALVLSSCEDGAAAQADLDASSVIRDVPAKVILPTYADLVDKAGLLQNAVAALASSPTADNLTAARNAWRAARSPWEQNEGFLFGPVETLPVDAPIDSWPLNQVELDSVMAGNAALTKDYIDALGDNLRGFHTIEYLLFGTGSKTAGDIKPRELEYLQGATASMVAKVKALQDSWTKPGGNFADTFTSAGAGSKVYLSQRSAVEELLNGMIGICDEVANGKISDPFDQKNRNLEESRFSNNSDADFADNIRSVRNVYLGGYGSSSGSGIKSLLVQKDAALAAKVEAQADSAINAILDMKPTFGDAIFNAPDKVEIARKAVQALKASLEGPVKGALLP